MKLKKYLHFVVKQVVARIFRGMLLDISEKHLDPTGTKKDVYNMPENGQELMEPISSSLHATC
jgi:hypothetical protein